MNFINRIKFRFALKGALNSLSLSFDELSLPATKCDLAGKVLRVVQSTLRVSKAHLDTIKWKLPKVSNECRLIFQWLPMQVSFQRLRLVLRLSKLATQRV